MVWGTYLEKNYPTLQNAQMQSTWTQKGSLTAANSEKRPKNVKKMAENGPKIPENYLSKFDKHLTRPKIEETNCGQRLQLFT